MFSSSQKPARLQKKLTMEERLEQRRDSMRLWVYRNFFYLLIALTLLGFATFIMISIMFIGGTESGNYYNNPLIKGGY